MQNTFVLLLKWSISEFLCVLTFKISVCNCSEIVTCGAQLIKSQCFSCHQSRTIWCCQKDSCQLWQKYIARLNVSMLWMQFNMPSFTFFSLSCDHRLSYNDLLLSFTWSQSVKLVMTTFLKSLISNSCIKIATLDLHSILSWHVDHQHTQLSSLLKHQQRLCCEQKDESLWFSS